MNVIKNPRTFSTSFWIHHKDSATALPSFYSWFWSVFYVNVYAIFLKTNPLSLILLINLMLSKIIESKFILSFQIRNHNIKQELTLFSIWTIRIAIRWLCKYSQPSILDFVITVNPRSWYSRTRKQRKTERRKVETQY